MRCDFLVTFEFHQPYTEHVSNGNAIIMLNTALCYLPAPHTLISAAASELVENRG